jgi:hypothetical protein
LDAMGSVRHIARSYMGLLSIAEQKPAKAFCT